MPAMPTTQDPAAAADTPTLSVRTVWISDLHLGTPGCQAHALLDFLRDVECEIDRIGHQGFVGSGSTGLVDWGAKSSRGGDTGGTGTDDEDVKLHAFAGLTGRGG